MVKKDRVKTKISYYETTKKGRKKGHKSGIK